MYSHRAMQHLEKISTIVFLKVEFPEIKRRIHNFESRGIAKHKDQTFQELFEERQILYNRYSQLTVDCGKLDQEEIAGKIVSLI